MAFSTQGTFGQETKTLTPLEQLLQTSKPKTAGQQANVYSVPGRAATFSADVPADTGARSASAPTDLTTLPNNPLGEGRNPEIHYVSNDPNSPYFWQTLGFADASYAGLPYEMGFRDDAGTWQQTRDMRSVAEQMHELANMPIPDRPDLIDLTTSDPYTGIQNLVQLLQDPNTTDNDRQAALAAFEQQMGMNPGDFANYMGQMFTQMQGGVGAQQGLSQAYQDQWNQETGLEIQAQREEYNQMLEALGAQGRSVAGFQQMDQIARSLSTEKLKRDVELATMNNARQEVEYQALNARWNDMFRNQQISSQQYLDNVNQNRTQALQGYALEINTIVEQNKLTLEAYQADLSAVQLHSQIVYNSIMADMGVSESMMQQLQDQYEMYMAPYYAALDQASSQAAIDAANQSNTLNAIGTAVGMAGTGAAIGAALGPVGAVVGAAVGALAGVAVAIFGSSVICTELASRGLMDAATHRLDAEFGRVIMGKRPDVYRGYLRFADGALKLMRKSKFWLGVAAWITKRWSTEMIYLLGKSKKRSIIGILVMRFGFIMCSYLGKEKHHGVMVAG